MPLFPFNNQSKHNYNINNIKIKNYDIFIACITLCAQCAGTCYQ